jgi:NAD(P)-dependent dehydrogenase (short-subunit alcohol dehydrogenase family)
MYVVITGTSRGIGLELARLALTKGHHVLAIARRPLESQELMNLKLSHQKLELLKLDLLETDAHEIIKEAVSSWPQIDVLINNAGIYEDDETIENFEKSFLTNSIKPFFIARALTAKMNASNRPVSLQITSAMGSIAENSSGGSYSYRASKAALNMLFKSFSVDEKKIISLLVHPGWVQTRMGGAGAPTDTLSSASGIWKLIDSAKPSQSGTFLDYRGDSRSW